MIKKILKKDKNAIKIDFQYSGEAIVLKELLEIAAEKSLNEMIKCKDRDSMENISTKRNKELFYSKFYNKTAKYIEIDAWDLDIVLIAVKEYKEQLFTDIKKSSTQTELDSLCEKNYFCTQLETKVINAIKKNIDDIKTDLLETNNSDEI